MTHTSSLIWLKYELSNMPLGGRKISHIVKRRRFRISVCTYLSDVSNNAVDRSNLQSHTEGHVLLRSTV